jgi:hypothetical protein
MPVADRSANHTHLSNHTEFILRLLIARHRRMPGICISLPWWRNCLVQIN